MKESDINGNTINNLNSRYYPAQEFKSLNTFNIFHSNLDGLESKFERLINFVNTTKMSLDIICLSEKSQKLNRDFDTDVMIDGYKKPYTTGSNINKGGVAIYILEII